MFTVTVRIYRHCQLSTSITSELALQSLFLLANISYFVVLDKVEHLSLPLIMFVALKLR